MTEFLINWGIVIAVALSVFGAGYGYGHHNASKADAAAYAVASNKALADHLHYIEGQQSKLDKAQEDLKAAQDAQHTEYRTITQTVEKVVTRPVYRNVCLDDDGLRLVNEAVSGLARPATDPVSTPTVLPAAPHP